jgi:hypothetical protein
MRSQIEIGGYKDAAPTALQNAAAKFDKYPLIQSLSRPKFLNPENLQTAKSREIYARKGSFQMA